MTAKALRARVVYPVAAPPIEDGVVVVEGGRVQRIGRQAPSGVEIDDLGDVALFPGFVNAHTHLEFSGLNRRVGRSGVPLPKWIRQVIEKRPAGKKLEKAIESGLEESLVSGVTTVAEICRTETDAYRVEGPSPRLVLLQESIGFSQARAGSALNAAEGRLKELDTLLAEADGGAIGFDNGSASGHPLNGHSGNGHSSNGHGTNGHASANGFDGKRAKLGYTPDRLTIGLSPHAPYTASPQLIRELVSVAVERSMPVAMHLAESPEELQLLHEGKGPFQEILEERGMWDPWVIGRGSAPLDYLRMLTRAPKSLVVHGNYLDHAELAMMGRHAGAMALVYCPRTHAHFKHKPYPLAEALELGVPVCLGTDSRASNPDLSILAEMQEVARHHRHMAPETILRMGTLAGARALGLPDVGSIRPGAHADLVTVPLAGGKRPDEMLARILVNEEAEVDNVWLGGELVETETVFV